MDPSAFPATARTPHALPVRRRIVLMRHGSVDYFRPDGSAIPPQGVPLNAAGQAQADAAGSLFAAQGVVFDRVVTSGLPRTVQTAERVLAAAGQQAAIARDERLQEIRPGRLDRIPREDLAAAFTEVFHQGPGMEQRRFLGGESVGEMLDRVLPALHGLLDDPAWQQMLLVLHGGVNRAVLTYALTGARGFLGRFEQAPACINLIDVGPQDMVLRAVNLAPTAWLHAHDRATTMERLLAQYLRAPS
jgi:broad specificity phosphatase PhoE